MNKLPVECAAHILVCTNERTADSPMPSCASAGDQVFEALHALVRARGLLGRVWVTRTACLGWCHAEGATVIVYPAATLFRRVLVGDCQQIMDETVLPLVRKSRA